MPPGAFVRVLFPTGEQPARPGLPHIGYVLGALPGFAMVAYTTSQPWPAGIPFRLGARLFNAHEAAALNQSRAFIMRLDVLARHPLTSAWFPEIDNPGQGVIATASADLRRDIAAIATSIASRRRELLQLRGL